MTEWEASEKVAIKEADADSNLGLKENIADPKVTKFGSRKSAVKIPESVVTVVEISESGKLVKQMYQTLKRQIQWLSLYSSSKTT